MKYIFGEKKGGREGVLVAKGGVQMGLNPPPPSPFFFFSKTPHISYDTVETAKKKIFKD